MRRVWPGGKKKKARWERLFVPIGNARLALVIAAVAILFRGKLVVFWFRSTGFIGLVIWHEQVMRTPGPGATSDRVLRAEG